MTTLPLLRTIKVLLERKKEKWSLGRIQHLPLALSEGLLGVAFRDIFSFSWYRRTGLISFATVDVSLTGPAAARWKERGSRRIAAPLCQPDGLCQPRLLKTQHQLPFPWAISAALWLLLCFSLSCSPSPFLHLPLFFFPFFQQNGGELYQDPGAWLYLFVGVREAAKELTQDPNEGTADGISPKRNQRHQAKWP